MFSRSLCGFIPLCLGCLSGAGFAGTAYPAAAFCWAVCGFLPRTLPGCELWVKCIQQLCHFGIFDHLQLALNADVICASQLGTRLCDHKVSFSKQRMVMELLGSAQVKEEDENFESPLDILFERLAMRDPESIAVKQYGIYKQAAGKTAKSILVSVGVRLAAFNLPQIARLTMTDELHLDDLGERRVALFCCIPDSDKSLNYLVGMVYTQLIQTLFYQADRVHRGRLPVPVHCLMDEFPNISLPKDSFQSALATMRSRGIFCSIIVQNIAQLKSMYKDSWESLVGLCDEFLYLGGNEQGTHKYVSELIGKETVETTSRSLSRGRSGSSSTSHQQTARDLMTPDEVRLLSNDKALLFVRGERPVMDWKYNLLRHPNIRFTEDGGAPPYDYTVAPDAHEDLAGNAENYELLDMDDFLPAAEQPKPMFTYPRRNAHASQQD